MHRALSRLWLVFSIVVGVGVLVVGIPAYVSLARSASSAGSMLTDALPFQFQLGYDDFLWAVGLLYVAVWFGRGMRREGVVAFVVGMALTVLMLSSLSLWREYTFSPLTWKLAGCLDTPRRRLRMEGPLRDLLSGGRIASRDDVLRWLGAPDQGASGAHWEYDMGYRAGSSDRWESWLAISFDAEGRIERFEFDAP